MRALAILAGALLAACASPTPTPHRIGAPTASSWPQAAEQCAAQPTLPWCAHDGR